MRYLWIFVKSTGDEQIVRDNVNKYVFKNSLHEPMTRIELAHSAWKADSLPLGYIGKVGMAAAFFDAG